MFIRISKIIFYNCFLTLQNIMLQTPYGFSPSMMINAGAKALYIFQDNEVSKIFFLRFLGIGFRPSDLF